MRYDKSTYWYIKAIIAKCLQEGRKPTSVDLKQHLMDYPRLAL